MKCPGRFVRGDIVDEVHGAQRAGVQDQKEAQTDVEDAVGGKAERCFKGPVLRSPSF